MIRLLIFFLYANVTATRESSMAANAVALPFPSPVAGEFPPDFA